MRRSRVPSLAALAAALPLAAVTGCGSPPDQGSAPADPWTPLLDGKTLAGWEKADFGDGDSPRVEDGSLIIPPGKPMAGVRYTGPFPRSGYEIRLEAMRVEGSDFFCGLTFPAVSWVTNAEGVKQVQDSHASLIIGGWGGGVCGVSSFDGLDASENETTIYREFTKGQWYRVRLRVMDSSIEAWLDDEKIVGVVTEGLKVDVRGDISPCIPLGLATYRTTAAIRNMKWRPVEDAG